MNEKVLNQAAARTAVEGSSPIDRHPQRNDFAGGRSAAKRNPANRWHNLIVTNTAVALGSRMSGHKAEMYISNMRVKLPNGLVSVPDLVLVNTAPSFGDQNADLLLNPTIVIDVMPSETNSVDKTQRLESLLATDTVKECLLIKQDEMRIEHYTKQNAKQWLYRIYNERDDVITLDPINCKLSLSEIYAQVKFGQAEFSSRAVN
ncbi:MAG: Uma2 family endonuclease [Acidobacteria bacterium]|nr:Uma2 family endonuclease [Acidobacteriota bacterium]